MRLDKFLQLSRLVKSRNFAQEACDAGLIQVNGRCAKSALSVAPGDLVQVTHSGVEPDMEGQSAVSRLVSVRILSLPQKSMKKALAQECYETYFSSSPS